MTAAISTPGTPRIRCTHPSVAGDSEPVRTATRNTRLVVVSRVNILEIVFLDREVRQMLAPLRATKTQVKISVGVAHNIETKLAESAFA